ncbi:hypothetical protein ACH4OW_33785 [Streptomyces sp. NPDC017056]|uniref:hypothetical protein n=1 Tax=Streptomyces sp. NPDC017056 TaxID=3364973 RepID=UPI0037952BD8
MGGLRDRPVRLLPHCRRPMLWADALIHAAALHAPHVGRLAEEMHRAANVDATAALLADAVRLGVRRSSTSAVSVSMGTLWAPRTARCFGGRLPGFGGGTSGRRAAP